MLGACQGGSAKEAPPAAGGGGGGAPAAAPGAGAGAVTPGTVKSAQAAPALDRAPVLELVQRWAKLQNDGNFAGYSALYAPGFSGVKRVGERPTVFDRAGWLQDRQKMFQRDQHVVASGVEILRSGDQLSVLFEQQWSSSTFADRGKKLLTLVPSGASWQIAREEMIDSKLLAPAERSGVCAQLHSLLESGGDGLQHYAEVTPNQQGAEMTWSAVRSQEEADERSPDGTAWELWTVAEREGWRLASLSASSASGDWISENELCFRPNGTLAQLTDTLRTFYSEHGLVNDTVTRSYAPDGSVLSSKRDARFVESGKRAAPGTYQRPEPSVVKTLSGLPFASLLQPAH